MGGGHLDIPGGHLDTGGGHLDISGGHLDMPASHLDTSRVPLRIIQCNTARAARFLWPCAAGAEAGRQVEGVPAQLLNDERA
ncbi:hypothetical protein BE20_08325 [Sorangium cellulosum]|nr:hypothetical protein BE20_08325 [Sorangium cellulosum]